MRNLLLLLVVLAVAACGPGASPSQDGAPVDAEREIDAGPPADAPPDEFGDACATAADCAGGVCVDGPLEDVCTFGCTADCPLGWECRVTEVDGVLRSLCLPVVVSQCVMCTDDDQCPGGACIEIGGGNYCLPGCFEGSCPVGYSCGDDPSGEHAGGFCIPDSGSCDCSAENDGAVRTCMNANGIGTCYGVEVCDADTGWGSCNAPDAMTEVCDGADNDCDFLIDDGLSGGACANTNADGSCPGTALCTGVGGPICQGQIPAAEACDYADNNCNGTSDEPFVGGSTGLGMSCTEGDGGCERFGVYRCDAAGTGTECSAMAGDPVMELCNGVDDDCLGDIDEDFLTGPTALGNTCNVGDGVCQRQGNYVCDDPPTATACGATAGDPTSANEGPSYAGTCNTLDDDCDGTADDGWQTGGVYSNNRACGSCAVDCTVIYALPTGSPTSYGTCVVSGTPGCQFNCNGGAYNLNGQVADGCEFAIDPLAIYVSYNDTGADDVLGAGASGCGRGPVGTVAGYHPCRTLAAGMSQATTLGKTKLFVANAMYADQLTLVNGRSMYGGYLPNLWSRDAAATGTMLLGTKPSGASNEHVITVDASGVTSTTVFDGFVVFGAVASGSRGNSYAIYASGATSALTISNNVIFGGKGGGGTSGLVGLDGTDGTGGTGRATNPAGFDAKLANAGAGVCNSANDRPSGGGAVMMCGASNVSGGAGGGNECPLTSDCTLAGSACMGYATFFEDSGLVGVGGQAGGGAGGTGGGNGYDMVQDNTYCYLASQPSVCSISHRFCSGAAPCPGGETCTFVIGPNYGTDGTNGGDASNGTTAAGCSATGGSLDGVHWQGGTGASGNTGGNGGGGGGGGAGGGARCKGCVNNFDNLGAHGGGGGGGGCGGELGTGATTGGGAFGIFLVGSTTGPVITANRIIRGEGGAGGAGGAGGQGGAGGSGGDGGLSAVFCAELAGRGGNGGDGGHGSGGGGGCGGASDAIRTYGITGTPNYCTLTGIAANAISGGGGGIGGAGGYSISNPGSSGTQPTVGDCAYN